MAEDPGTPQTPAKGSAPSGGPASATVGMVGRYELIREIGRGGMAIVYLARQAELDRYVALKELSSFHASSPEFAERFMRESRLAGSLSHPNIVTVHDYFEHNGTPYIAMEYVQRGSLRPHVGRLSVAQIAGVLEGILAGLTHAESLGIVHRDLKPENIMVTADGRVKIADFGIAKATQSAGTAAFMTATGTTVGTPAYMAPEQAMAKGIGPWTDLYSVGVMTYEMVVGRVPFHDSEAPMAILLRHVNEPIPPAAEVKAGVDRALSAWIDALLVKDPDNRVRSAAAAWDSLEEIILELVEPRWRREARLPTETPGLATPLPLTPAPFESGHVPTPEPAPAPEPAPEPAPASSEFVTFDPGGARAPTPGPPAAVEKVAPQWVSEAPAMPAQKPVPAAQAAPAPQAEAREPDLDLAAATPSAEAAQPALPPESQFVTFGPAPEPPLAPEAPPAEAPVASTPAEPPPLQAADPTTPPPTPRAQPTTGAAQALHVEATPAATPDQMSAPGATPTAKPTPDLGATPVPAQPSATGPASAATPSQATRLDAVRTVPVEPAELPAAVPEPPAEAPTPPAARSVEDTSSRPIRDERAKTRQARTRTPVRSRPDTTRTPVAGRRALAGIAAVTLAAAAAVGYVVAPSGSRSASGALTGSASSGQLHVSLPAGWQRQGSAPATPSLRLTDPLPVAPRNGSTGALVIGTAKPSGPTLLPASLVAALPAQPQSTAVKLGGVHFYRYLDLMPNGANAPETVYAAPTTAGVVVGVCLTPHAGDTATVEICERVLGSLKMTSGSALPLGPSAAYASGLGKALSDLNHAIATAGSQLSDASTAAKQATAASSLQSTYEHARTAAQKLAPGPLERDANGAIVTALGRAGSAYGSLARAARRQDHAGYDRASNAVSSAIAQLSAALSQLKPVGYNFD